MRECWLWKRRATLPFRLWAWGMMTTRIGLVGDRHLFMAGLARIVDEPPFEVVLEAASLADAIDAGFVDGVVVIDKPAAVDEIVPDIRRLKASSAKCRVVLIDDVLDQAEMVRSFAAGVNGYLLAAISPEALRESLRLVVLGEHVFPSQLVSLLLSAAPPPAAIVPPASRDALSERETAIVARLAEGMPNKVIAQDLTITEATVKVHLKSILKKLGVTNRTQAAVWAITNGMRASAPLGPH